MAQATITRRSAFVGDVVIIFLFLWTLMIWPSHCVVLKSNEMGKDIFRRGCRHSTFYGNCDNFNLSSSLSSRRRIISDITKIVPSFMFSTLMSPSEPALARNLPISNGADTSNVGTVTALIPIVRLRRNIALLREILQHEKQSGEKSSTNNVSKTKTILSFQTENGTIKIPTREEDFKRLFDAYSDQVSYKQRFLDQNAFLVYYTKGYDGQGRDSLEKDPVNERQTLQFGARNEAWVCWDDFLAEWDFYTTSSANNDDDAAEGFSDMTRYLANTIQAIDEYLRLSPREDLKDAENEVL